MVCGQAPSPKSTRIARDNVAVSRLAQSPRQEMESADARCHVLVTWSATQPFSTANPGRSQQTEIGVKRPPEPHTVGQIVRESTYDACSSLPIDSALPPSVV